MCLRHRVPSTLRCVTLYTLPHQTAVYPNGNRTLFFNEVRALAVNLTATQSLSTMSSSPNESKALCAYLGTEESVDYGSDTSVSGDARTMSDTPMSEVQPPTTLGPFSEHDDANAPLAPHLIPGSDDAIITNSLDEQ